MKIVILASGSEGNATYIETREHKILFDLGMNTKYIVERLADISVSPSEIDYVFISHTHKDHCSALDTFIKRYKPTVCISLVMANDLLCLKGYEHIIFYEDELKLSNTFVEIIKTSHDATDSRGFIITDEDSSAVYLTDTGYINGKYFEKLQNKDYYLFESNHDTIKLIDGPYPKWLKTRILSAYGHLSNKDAAVYLTKLIGENTKKIILMHLSKKNNSEELALLTIKEIFTSYNIEFDNIKCAKQDEIVEV